MDRNKKEDVVAKLSEKFEKAKSVVFCEFSGLTVEEANSLRRGCRGVGVDYFVVKNSLIYRALPADVREEVKPFLNRTTSIAIDYEEGVVGPKTMANFSKDHASLVAKVGVMDGGILTAEQVAALARIPGREELLSKLLGSIQAPATNVLRCVSGVSTKLAGLFRAYQTKLEEGAA